MKSIGCVKYDFIKSKRVIIKTIEIDYFCNSLLCRGGKRKIVEKNGRGFDKKFNLQRENKLE